MGVSENGATLNHPFIDIFSIINHPFRGTTILGNHHMFKRTFTVTSDILVVNTQKKKKNTTMVFGVDNRFLVS